MSNDEIMGIKLDIAHLSEQVDNVNKVVDVSNRAILKLTETIGDLKVVNNRLNKTEQEIETLFAKNNQLNKTIDKFIQKITFMLFGGLGLLIISVVVDIVTHKL